MSKDDARDRITKIASRLIDAKGTADTGWLTHLARVAGATFHELDVPVGAIVAARDATVVTYDGLHPLLGYATAGLHTMIWHVGMPAFSTCRNCGLGSGGMLYGRPAGERGEWELRCEACLGTTARTAATELPAA